MQNGAKVQDVDVANMGVLLSVVAASFVTLGVIIYMFGEDPSSSSMAAAYDTPMRTERMMRKRTAEPGTIVEPGMIDWRG
jgi:hypothetical protein